MHGVVWTDIHTTHANGAGPSGKNEVLLVCRQSDAPVFAGSLKKMGNIKQYNRPEAAYNHIFSEAGVVCPMCLL